jgi:lysosomal Pro-X carboxypeptidase
MFLFWRLGSHCLDLYPPTSSDPDWLVALRDKENKIIAYWLAEYYAKLN